MLQQQTQSPGWRVLNRDVIKYIAMTAMLLNHIANIFLVPGTLWYSAGGYRLLYRHYHVLFSGRGLPVHPQPQTVCLTAVRVRCGFTGAVLDGVCPKRHSGISGFQHDVHAVPVFLHLVVYRNHPEPFLRGVLIVLLIFGSLFCDWALLAPVFTLLFRWSGQDQNDCGSVLRFLPRCLAG